jgi:predicted DNA-binding transcriptional regulator YafY
VNRAGPGRVFGGRRIFPSGNFWTPASAFSNQPFAAQLVRERVWHHSQKIKELREGGLELQLQLGSLEEIERWVLSWGDQAEVLEPAKLRQRLLEIGQKFVAAYAAK